MFTKSTPAKSIGELVLYLEAAHQSNFVYRGQTKDYGTMIPSLFRKINLTEQEGFLMIPAEQESSQIEVLRATFIYVIFGKYGNVVGNYIAQQYCALSGCIDITDNVDIAAFFATMSFPDYTAPIPDSDQLGVIYRFDKNLFDNNIKPAGVKDIPYAVDAKKGEYEVYTDKTLVENQVTKEFYFADQSLISPNDTWYTLDSNITAFADMKPFLDDLEEKNYTSKNIEYPGEPFLFKRAFAQYGGMIQPKYLCKCVGETRRSINNLEDFVGFEDIYNKYGMTAFYFRHGEKVSKFSRNELWPNMWEDGTFATLCYIINAVKEKFNLADLQSQDIIDIGYLGNGHT